MLVLQRSFVSLQVARAPIEKVVDAFHVHKASPIIAEETPLLFPKQPYHADQSDSPALLWSPRCDENVTAFMPNASGGGAYFHAWANGRFGIEVADTRFSDPPDVNEFILHLSGRRSRIVRSMMGDVRWEFWQDGEPLAFEQLDLYKRRLIRDRVTKVTVLSYLESWGAPVRDELFWSSCAPSYTFVRRDRANNSFKPNLLRKSA